MSLHILNTTPDYDRHISPHHYCARKNITIAHLRPLLPPTPPASPARLLSHPTASAPLDHTAYPHILDLVIAHAPPDVLPTLRLVSRYCLEAASCRLYAHVAMAVRSGSPRGAIELTDPVRRVRLPGLRWRSWADRHYPARAEPCFSPDAEPTADMLVARAEHASCIARLQRYTRTVDNFNSYAGSLSDNEWGDLAAAVRADTVVRTAKFLGIPNVTSEAALHISFGDMTTGYPRRPRDSSVYTWWDSPATAFVNHWSSERVVVNLRYASRDPHLRWRGMSVPRITRLGELVLLFTPYTRLLDTFSPAPGEQPEGRRVLGMLHCLVGAMACSLPARETAWTLVGLEGVDTRALELEVGNHCDWETRRNAIRQAIEDAITERDWTRTGFEGGWDRLQGEVRVPQLRLLTLAEWRGEVGAEVFALATEAPGGARDILHADYQ
ncbi:hypothetical protein Q8F55_009259 [Vanrija albida]|uniref:F-box domain-containing protein n=1 Tax=Vanrija albida TaxID=181172 RepID=A0ABR3PTB3_9TREE